MGDNPDSKLLVMSEVDFPRFEVSFGGNDAYREALIIDAEEFIGVKSYKAKGKRLTTFEVATIKELEPLRFAPVKEEAPDDNDGGDDDINSEEIELIDEVVEMDIDVVKVNNVVVETTEISEEVEEQAEAIEIEEEPQQKPLKLKRDKTPKKAQNDSDSDDDVSGQLTLF